MSQYTGDIVKQWACDAVFSKLKPSKDVQTAFQTCALQKAFMGITEGKLMKKEDKWLTLSLTTAENTKTFITHNFDGVHGIPVWCTDSFVSKKDMKVFQSMILPSFLYFFDIESLISACAGKLWRLDGKCKN